MWELFECIDVIENLQTPPKIPVVENSTHVAYIKRANYHVDLMRGQLHKKDVIKQFDCDVSRCRFHFNGLLTQRLMFNIPVELLRFCTQAVMALPIELMQRSMVAECSPSHSMYVFASANSVTVTKKLRILEYEYEIPVDITIHIDLSEPWVVVTYQFLSKLLKRVI